MSYRIHPDSGLTDEVQRIAGREIHRATSLLVDPDIDRHFAVHKARRAIKRLRALLSLVRAADRRKIDRSHQRLGEVGRTLSAIRDAAAMVEVFDRLREGISDRMEPAALDGFRLALVTRRDRIVGAQVDADALVSGAVDGLRREMRTIERFKAKPGTRWAGRILGNGIARSRRRARAALAAAQAHPDPEAFHALRKRINANLFHLRLLREIHPERIGPLAKAASDLGTRLGHHHDICVLIALIDGEPSLWEGVGEPTAMRAALVGELGALEKDILLRAGEVLAIGPGRLRRIVERRYAGLAED